MNLKTISFAEYFRSLGIQEGQHILLHAAYRKIRQVFADYPIELFLKILINRIGEQGSLIMPAFSYNFRRENYPDDCFDRLKSPSRVGAVSETFRNMPNVIRTSGPTHSFCLWGQAAAEIGIENSPESPLGKGSTLEWLASQDNGYVTMIGVNFTAFSFGHYLEQLAPVPWHDYSPWEHLRVQPVGISTTGEQSLRELPGCSQSFTRFEQFLIEEGLIEPHQEGSLCAYHIPVRTLLDSGLLFLRDRPQDLLCDPGSCQACDERWQFYLTSYKTGHTK